MIDAARLVPREFSPGEMATIAGVSTTLQRDWRRRGLLSEREAPGWTRWSLQDVIEARMMSFFAAAGFSVKQMRMAAMLASGPVLQRLMAAPGALVVEYEGHERDAPAVRLEQPAARFMVVRQPLDPSYFVADVFRSAVLWCRSDRELQALFRSSDADGYTMIDLARIADSIVDRAGLPLFRAEIDDGELGTT